MSSTATEVVRPGGTGPVNPKMSVGRWPVVVNADRTAVVLTVVMPPQVIAATAWMSTSRRARSSKSRLGVCAGLAGSATVMPVRKPERAARRPIAVRGSTWVKLVAVSLVWQLLQVASEARWRAQFSFRIPKFNPGAFQRAGAWGFEPRKLVALKNSGTGGMGFWKSGGVRGGSTLVCTQLLKTAPLLKASIGVSAVVVSFRK